MGKFVSKKTFIAANLMLGAFCVLLMLTTLLIAESRDNGVEHRIEVVDSFAVSVPVHDFVLRNIDGYLAICSSDDGSVIESLPIKLKSDDDTSFELENGIYVSSFYELITLVHSFEETFA